MCELLEPRNPVVDSQPVFVEKDESVNEQGHTSLHSCSEYCAETDHKEVSTCAGSVFQRFDFLVTEREVEVTEDAERYNYEEEIVESGSSEEMGVSSRGDEYCFEGSGYLAFFWKQKSVKNRFECSAAASAHKEHNHYAAEPDMLFAQLEIP